MNLKDDLFIQKILITGGAGFIGSHLAIYLTKKYKNSKIIVLDKLDYCSNINNLSCVSKELNFKFYKGNILDSELLEKIFEKEKIDIVIHLAAYTHVDNSFKQSIKFTENNILGTHYLLETCKNNKLKKFIYVSTDEVYGSGLIDKEEEEEDNDDNYNYDKSLNNEKSILKPTNPYSASKAGAEHLVQSYYKSFKLPSIITRANNIYGPKQYPEKIIPKFINLLLNNKKCTIHGSGKNTRNYLYIDDIVSAFDIILRKGEIGNIYNIGTDFEISNLDVAKNIIDLCLTNVIGIDDYNKYINYIDDRPFNDHRYNINYSKLSNLGWKKSISWEDGIIKTFNWYKNNRNYWLNFNINNYFENNNINNKDNSIDNENNDDTSKSFSKCNFDLNYKEKKPIHLTLKSEE
ncbi:hypothetical protein RB653_004165 [Dictyostelium firmibasis]|uniref:NAD(P)-binding domain-containing protein n=1 Tax=Dictyostelium firmibasis TaxID=79012 RepID=A0AAN7U7E5_9MYCE